MKLHLFKTLWGHEGTLPEAIAEAKSAGFNGLETIVPEGNIEREKFISTLAAENMDLIAEISTCTPPGVYLPEFGKSPKEHLASLEQSLIHSLDAKPRFITTMAGDDAWTPAQAFKFFSGVLKLEQKYQIAISCETHRGRYTYSPWLTRDLLKRLPSLKITCDFSHWCVVGERLVLDQDPSLLALVASHAFHIHSRVGYAQGPQVPDPRAPEYAEALASHEHWWDVVWDSMKSRGRKITTLTPEFGPDGYLQCAPFTGIPVVDLWTVNRWTGLRQKRRFETRYCHSPAPATREPRLSNQRAIPANQSRRRSLK